MLRLLRHPLRLFTRLSGFLFSVFQVSWAYFLLKKQGPISPGNRESWMHQSAIRLAKALRVKIAVYGNIPKKGLIASNHLSYLDIVVIASIAPGIFVSKNEVRYWPIIGFLSTWAGTLYLRRDRRADVANVGRRIADNLMAERRVIVFPEGTSSNGREVLPFHSSLFSPSIKTKTRVTPCQLSYSEPGNDPENLVCYWGSMLFLTHFLKLLTLDSIQATLKFGEEIHENQNRKQLAKLAHQQVVELGSNF
jgi:1-acyl-sn-glycerol-3-phosphate acyltransferase